MFKGLRGFGKSRQVTVIIPAGNTATSISFPEQSDLRYARILGMETYTATDVAVSTPDTTTVITDAQLKLINLTLETNDPDELFEELPANENPNNTGRFRTTSQNIKWQPLVSFHRVQNNAAPWVYELFEFNNIFITWEKSFITMPVPINPGSSAKAVIFQVYYSFRSVYGKLIRRT